MTITEIAAKFDSYIRNQITKLPPAVPIHIYSNARKWFLNNLFTDLPDEEIKLPSDLTRTFWGLKFQSPLFNAAGIFKDAYGYEVVRRQGAGAFLIGTVTPHLRNGNAKGAFRTPFLPMPNSKATLNWLGLPNKGFEEIAKRISIIDKKSNCPIGVSISSSPNESGDFALKNLLEGFEIFTRTKVDFIELNESCPNVPHEHSENFVDGLDITLIHRLEFLQDKFLSKRNKNLPVIVKFSNDTTPEQIPVLIKKLIELGFDGINLGNTSTQYEKYRNLITPAEQVNYDFFINNFGGGLSGNPLKENSLQLASIAAKAIKELNLQREFHVIRTGGIECKEDWLKSEIAAISLNQWFTGYFEMFSKVGHKV